MIGDRVKAARESAGMTQADVVSLMNTRHGASWHQTTLSRIEHGAHLGLANAAALSEVLGVTLDFLAYGTTAPRVEDWRALAHRQDKALRHIEQAVKDAIEGRVS